MALEVTSRAWSSDTLVRGLAMARCQSMNLLKDPDMEQMQLELQKLEDRSIIFQQN